MSEQPAALRLADELDTEFTQGRVSNHSGRKAAAELRRLHKVNQELLDALKAIRNSAYMPQALIGLIDDAIAKGEQA